jgi:hypothetical protein
MRPLGPAIPICVTSPSDEVTRLEEAARESERRYNDIQMQLRTRTASRPSDICQPRSPTN